MRNVEFKAELRDPDLGRTIAEALGARYVGTLQQTDTYYRVGAGRLKKRETVGDDTEWIAYHRPDRLGAKLSSFTVYSDDEALERFGERPMPVWVVVRKRRDLYILGHVRIHLDSVEGLGEFFELEALMRPGHAQPSCEADVQRLRERFGPALGEPIACSYADLLADAG